MPKRDTSTGLGRLLPTALIDFTGGDYVIGPTAETVDHDQGQQDASGILSNSAFQLLD